MSIKLFYKAFTAFRIGIPAIHKTMDKYILEIIFFGYITKFKKMIERTMYSSIRSQSHKMDILPFFFCIRKSRNNFRIFQNTIICTSSIDLYQILIYDTSRADIKMTDFRISHLSIGQTYIFTGSLQLGIRISRQ